jgi:hypothetical protein
LQILALSESTRVFDFDTPFWNGTCLDHLKQCLNLQKV